MAEAPRNPDSVYDQSDLSHCSYAKSDFQLPTGGVVTVAHHRSTADVVTAEATVFRPTGSAARWSRPQAGPPGEGPGAWYEWRCSGKSGANAVYRPPVWIADGEQPGAAQPPVEDVAQLARRQLRPPTPLIVASPTGDQLVGVPTWMWLADGWAAVTATATVPAVSVTARASPTSVVWSMGDGSTVTCAGPGTPYPTGTDPAAVSPDCGHTYRRSSVGQPGQAFPVTVTIHWTVTWAGAGQGGVFPDLTTTSVAGFRVAEAQALNGGG